MQEQSRFELVEARITIRAEGHAAIVAARERVHHRPFRSIESALAADGYRCTARNAAGDIVGLGWSGDSRLSVVDDLWDAIAPWVNRFDRLRFHDCDSYQQWRIEFDGLGQYAFKSEGIRTGLTCANARP